MTPEPSHKLTQSIREQPLDLPRRLAQARQTVAAARK